MTTSTQAEAAPGRVPLFTRCRRWRTFCLLVLRGSKGASRIPHEPYPDLLAPGLCNIDLLGVNDPVHLGRPRKRRGASR